MRDTIDMDELVRFLSQRIVEVYHLTCEAAEEALRKSEFFRVLSESDKGYSKDDIEKYFRRYQNEVEYGAWNRNECGEIVE